MVLWVSLFMYMRHKIMMLEERVALLSKLTTTVAGLTAQNEQGRTDCMNCEMERKIESDESESEPESESDDEGDCESECKEFCMTNQVVEREFPILKSILLNSGPADYPPITIVELPDVEVKPEVIESLPEILSEVLQESFEVDVNLPKRKVSEDDVKTLVVNVD